MWQCTECELPGVRGFMATELHRTILGAEVSSDRGRGTKPSQLGTPRVPKAPEPEGREPSAGLPGHYQRTSLDLESSLGVCRCRASLPGESAEVVVCRWIEPLPVPGRDDCQEGTKGRFNSQAKVRASGLEANRLSPSLDSCLPPLSDHNAHNTRAIVRPQRRPAKDVSSLILPVRRRTWDPVPAKNSGIAKVERNMESVITCPKCQHTQAETMPEDRCIIHYQCKSCHAILRPKPGDCCVFCS